MSMMPPERVWRIDRRLIHQTAWKVHSQTWSDRQLERVSQSQFANGRVVGGWVAKSRWPIL
jgi:hypothetical protein